MSNPISYGRATEVLGAERVAQLSAEYDELIRTGDVARAEDLWTLLPPNRAPFNLLLKTKVGLVFEAMVPLRVRVIVTNENFAPRGWWLHLSCSVEGARLPNVEEIALIHRCFLLEREAYQVHLPPGKGVVVNEHVLRLYAPLAGPFLPDFSRGSGVR